MSRLTAYKLSWALASHLPPVVRSVHSRLWLSVLSSQDLIDLTVSSYNGRSGFEGEEHNSAGLWDWEDAVVREWFCGREKILVAAAGAGREMIALAQSGFSVTGFDAAADLVQTGRRNLAKANVSADLHLAAPCDIPANLEVHDALFVGRGAYHHIPDRHRRIAFLQACGTRLRPESPILIGDFHTRNSKRPAWLQTREPGDSVAGAFVHYFNEQEVRSEMDEAGFNLLEYRPTPFPGGGSLAHAIGRSR